MCNPSICNWKMKLMRKCIYNYTWMHIFLSVVFISVFQLEARLQPGDMVVFNNRRMVHGRKNFQLNGGSRHLQVCVWGIHSILIVFLKDVGIVAIDKGQICKNGLKKIRTVKRSICHITSLGSNMVKIKVLFTVYSECWVVYLVSMII